MDKTEMPDGEPRPIDEPGTLPPLYAGWMRDVMGEVKGEPEATCHDCVMLRKSPDDRGVFFDPTTKCCTYWPSLPNYLVGRILADEDPRLQRAREVLLQRLAARTDVYPLGVLAPARAAGEKRGSVAFAEFGRDPEHRCPYYEQEGGGLCGLWQHRNSVCATWFCKHERGIRGFRQWRLLRSLLEHVESKLAIWCALQLGIGDEATVLLSPKLHALSTLRGGEAGVREVSGASHATTWGHWNGRELDFYAESARLVGGLSWNEVKERIGAEVELFETAVRRARAELDNPVLPVAARPRELVADHFGATFVGLRSYSPYDPVDLPTRILGVLHHFESAPLHEAVRRIREQDGISLTRDDIQMLLDFGVLIPADDAPGARRD